MLEADYESCSCLLSKMNLLLLLGLCLCSPLKFISGQSEADITYFANLIDREVNAIADHQIEVDASEFRPNSDTIREYPDEFDYIIVGAGAAGAIVASRLSESRNNQVLLLEAGGDENDFTEIPSLSFFLYATNFTWNLFTTPQENMCLGMVNRQCGYPRGKGLGGSSIINSLNYVRGNKEDYDSWFRQGNPGWSWDDVFPFFLKSENASDDFDTRYHGSGGPVAVEYVRPLDDQYRAYVQANIERGGQYVDYNGPRQIGVSRVQFTANNGHRVSTNNAYLKPARKRRNLRVLTHSYVIKVNINKETKEAKEVIFSNGRQLFIVKARKEIVLSAGTLQTPQILMLSGIGNANDLRKHGIQAIQSLSVGYNLQDHYGYLALMFESNVTAPIHSLRENVRQYLNGYGPLTWATTSKGVAFFSSKYNNITDQPDLEILMITSNNTHSIIQAFTNYNNETFNAIWRDVDPTRSFTIGILLMHPKSRGTVKLQSADPCDFPLIDSNFYSDSQNEDFEVMYEGIQKVFELVDTNAFRKINARPLPTTHPGCRDLTEFSKDYWFCQLRHLTFPFYHPIGTCKMGPNPLQGAVVDHRLRVHGIKNLRVADSSIMPTHMSGHTYAPAMMIGEKAAQMIMSGN